MNNQEAIKSLKNIVEYWTFRPTEIEAAKLATSALEKQMPKPAEYHHKADGKCALTICPNCENRLAITRYVFPLDRYCKQCGQHYVVDVKDWSVEE